MVQSKASKLWEGLVMRLLAVHTVGYTTDLYKLVDFLNKSLKDRNLIFGLSKKDDDTMLVSIYDTTDNN
jgi:hypothetical protein